MSPQSVESPKTLILHQYDFSSFAEKARSMMGFKGLTWRAVETPPIAPKPKLTPLTGGYRRAPVLQDGADVWCDTKLIARELERRVPQPALFPAKTAGTGDVIAWWAEQQFMRPMALYVSGINADHMPEGLHADRAQVHGVPLPSVDAVRKAASRNLQIVRPQLKWIADMLADGRPYLLGDAPCIADFSTYSVVWFLGARPIDCRQELNPYPSLLAWRDRMAAIGHGNRINIDADEALADARTATPAAPRPSQPQEGDPLPGQRARVRANDNAKDWIEGEVSFVDADEIALLHENDEVGQVAVHFPRLGYDWRSA